MEPAHGAFVRLAGRMGYRALRDLRRRLRFSLHDLTKGMNVDEFAFRAGLDPGQLMKWSPVRRPTGRLVELRGELIRLGDWSTTFRRRCELCLNGDFERARSLGIDDRAWACHRFHWDVQSISTCPEHGCALTDDCSACGRRQRWSDPSLLYCACGARLTCRLFATARSVCSDYLAGRLGVSDRLSCELLDALDYRHAVRAVRILSFAASDAGIEAVGDFCTPADRGWTIAKNWVDSIPLLLDSLLKRRGRRGSGLIEAYGRLYTETDEQSAGPIFSEQLLAAIERHAVQHGIIAENECRRGRPPLGTVSVTGLARRLGRSYETTRSLLREANAIPRGSRRGVAFAIEASIADLLPPRQPESATQVLGVGKRQAAQLVAEFCLKNNLGRPCPEMARRWVSSLPTYQSLPSETGLLSDVCRNRAVSLANICHGIIAGRVRCTRLTATGGLSDFRVSVEDCVSLKRASEWTIKDVSQRFGAHHQALLELVKLGVLARHGRKLCRENVEAFFAEHLTTAQLAERLHIAAKQVIGFADRRGVHPAFGPPSVRQTFFRLQDCRQLSL